MVLQSTKDHTRASFTIRAQDPTGSRRRSRLSACLLSRALVIAITLAGPSIGGTVGWTSPALASTTEEQDPQTLSPISMGARIGELGDLYARVDQELDRNLADARAILAHFQNTYMDGDIRVPVTLRKAAANEDDIRELISEMRKGLIAHRRNAKVAGRAPEWPLRMTKWAEFNIRMSTTRLWQIKVMQSQQEFGRIAQDGAAAFEAARQALEAQIASIDLGEMPASEKAAARQDAFETAKAREARRAALIQVKAGRVIRELNGLRRRLAQVSWRWMAYADEIGSPEQKRVFRNHLFGQFGFDLRARLIDPTDPIFQEDITIDPEAYWIMRFETDPEALGLLYLADPEGEPDGTPIPLDLTSLFQDQPVERFDPAALTRPGAPTQGAPAERTLKEAAALATALDRQRSRLEWLEARLDAAQTGGGTSVERFHRTRVLAFQVWGTGQLAQEPVEAAAMANAVRAELAARESALATLRTQRGPLAAIANADTSNPVVQDLSGTWVPAEDLADEDDPQPLSAGDALRRLDSQIADLETAVKSDTSRIAILEDRAQTIATRFAENKTLAEGWSQTKARFAALREEWVEETSPAVRAALPSLPDGLPDLGKDPAAALVSLEDTVDSLRTFLNLLAPSVGADQADASWLREEIAAGRAGLTRLYGEVGAVRATALRLAAQALATSSHKEGPAQAQSLTAQADAVGAAYARLSTDNTPTEAASTDAAETARLATAISAITDGVRADDLGNLLSVAVMPLADMPVADRSETRPDADGVAPRDQ